MRVVRMKMGNTFVLVEALDEDLEVIAQSKQPSRGLKRTGAKEKLEEACVAAKDTIRAVVEELVPTIESLGKKTRPQRAEIELDLGFSVKAGCIIANGEGSAALKVKMVWEPGRNAQTG
jgi:hypothetical protein